MKKINRKDRELYLKITKYYNIDNTIKQVENLLDLYLKVKLNFNAPSYLCRTIDINLHSSNLETSDYIAKNLKHILKVFNPMSYAIKQLDCYLDIKEELTNTRNTRSKYFTDDNSYNKNIRTIYLRAILKYLKEKRNDIIYANIYEDVNIDFKEIGLSKKDCIKVLNNIIDSIKNNKQSRTVFICVELTLIAEKKEERGLREFINYFNPNSYHIKQLDCYDEIKEYINPHYDRIIGSSYFALGITFNFNDPRDKLKEYYLKSNDLRIKFLESIIRYIK